MLSPPSRRRGLKCQIGTSEELGLGVASLAEAWIEIVWQAFFTSGGHVASLAEAWIEMGQFETFSKVPRSPPSRRRGLK